MCDFLAVTLVHIIWKLLPKISPDLNSLINNTNWYVRSHYYLVGTWFATTYFLAVFIAFAGGIPNLRKLGEQIAKSQRVSWLSPRESIVQHSGWWKVFHAWDDQQRGEVGDIYVGCELEDGSRIEGYLWSFNPGTDETDERSLTLSLPISLYPKGGSALVELNGIQFTVISAKRVLRLDVSHLSPEETQPTDVGDTANPPENCVVEPKSSVLTRFMNVVQLETFTDRF